MSSNSWVLITGGNRGLGYVTAKKLVTDGESVIIGARTQASGAFVSRFPDNTYLWGCTCVLPTRQGAVQPSALCTAMHGTVHELHLS